MIKSRTMSESACQPYAGKSSDQHVEFVTRTTTRPCATYAHVHECEENESSSPSRTPAVHHDRSAERTLTESLKLFPRT